jgi:hypothetical protein
MATEYCKPGRATHHASTTHGSIFRVEAERVALADTARSFISDQQLKRDITHWRKVGTLETVIEDRYARHQENGRNQKRVTTFLANDPRFGIVRQSN